MFTTDVDLRHTFHSEITNPELCWHSGGSGEQGVVVTLVSSSLGQPAAAAETRSLLFRANLQIRRGMKQADEDNIVENYTFTSAAASTRTLA